MRQTSYMNETNFVSKQDKLRLWMDETSLVDANLRHCSPVEVGQGVRFSSPVFPFFFVFQETIAIFAFKYPDLMILRK